MLHKLIVTTITVLFALFAAPSMSATASQPNQTDLEDQAIEYARAGSDSRSEFLAITGKQAPVAEADEESVDCFYEYNSNHPDCSGTRPDRR